MRGHFDHSAVAHRYFRGRPRYHDLVVDRIEREIGTALPVDTALDVACGTGFSTVPLTRIARSVVGLDLSRAMLLHALAHPAVRYAMGSAEAVPLGSSLFDLITVGSAFHWFNASAFLAEARRVSTLRAWLIVYDNYIEEMEEEPTFHGWFFDHHRSVFPPPNVLRMSKQSLIDYLLSQTNVIAKVEGEGMPLGRVEQRLSKELEPFFQGRGEGTFRFQGPIVYARKRPD